MLESFTHLSAQQKCDSLPLLKIGLIADPQYCDCNASGTRYYRETLKKLPKAIDTLNKYKVDFVMNLGDMIDRYKSSYDSVIQFYESLESPFYSLLGNHAFSDVSESYLDNLTDLYDMPGYYYSFSYDQWRFLVLDGTELAANSRYLHPELADEGDSLWQEIQGEINDHTWNGGISRGQKSWMNEQLNETLEAGQNVILFCHFPLLPDTLDLRLWNDDEIIGILENYPNVVAYINGHEHRGSYDFRNGIHYITQKGMVETLDTSSFAILEIYSRELKIRGFGNISDTVLPYSNIRIKPTTFRLSDSIVHYSDHQGSFIGSIVPEIEDQNIDFQVSSDTSFYGNKYFYIRNDSLLLWTNDDISSLQPIQIEVVATGCEIDTSTEILGLSFDTNSIRIRCYPDDSLLSIYDRLLFYKDSLVTDYSRYGLEYSINFTNNHIFSFNESDSALLFNPLKVGSTEIQIQIKDDYSGQLYHLSFMTKVFDPLNHPPYVINSSPLEYEVFLNDTLVINLDNVFIDPDDDKLYFSFDLGENTGIEVWIENSVLYFKSGTPGIKKFLINTDDLKGGADSVSLSVESLLKPLHILAYGINEKLRIIPNPATDNIRIEIMNHNNFHYTVLDVSGTDMLSGYSCYNVINVKDLQPGIYFLLIMTDSGAAGYYKFLKISE